MSNLESEQSRFLSAVDQWQPEIGNKLQVDQPRCSSLSPRWKKQLVGIFWPVGGKLVIDSGPLSEAEPYGDHLTYPGSIWRFGRCFDVSAKAHRPEGYKVRGSAEGQGDLQRRHPSSEFLLTAASMKEGSLENRIKSGSSRI
jgi:hypothetical protein